MNPATHAIIDIGIAILFAGLSVPLIFRKVPMNHFYGIRFRQSFKSKEAWYEINEYGGKALLLSSLPILLSGVYGFLQKPQNYPLIGPVVLMISITAACLLSYRKARQIDQNGKGGKNTEQSTTAVR